MKRYSLLALVLVSSGLFAGSAMAQETNEAQDQKKADKLKQYDELIIRKKSDKDEKVVIEIKDGEVTVNGKPLEDYDNDNLSVRRGKGTRIFLNSPFRQEGGVKGFPENFNEMGGTRTFLGVITEEAPGGARITTVSKGSPAEKAGLKEKDIITKIDGEKVQDENDVARLVRKQKPDSKVAIVVLRDGKEVTVNTILGKTAEPAQNFNFSMPNMDMFRNFDFKFEPGDSFDFNAPRSFGARGKLGIKAQDTESGVGVKVLDVAEESAAGKSGIKEDDIITEFNGRKVNSADELAREAAEAKYKTKIPVKLLRNGKSVSLDLTIPKKLKTANL